VSDFTFHFDRREIPARRGDTIATALYRAGVRVFSRSFKYHRPRGLLCGVGRCPNCLMQVDDTPNVRACVTPAEPGQQVRHQNAWPSLRVDFLAINDRLSFLLPPGFYYKTFIRPRALWPLYERMLRHAAGLGRIDIAARPEERFDKVHRHTDLLVVGGGAAGLAAALTAADAGIDVTLVDEQPSLGGRAQWGATIPGDVSALAARVATHPHITAFTDATAFGVYEGGLTPVLQHNRMVGVRWRELVIATGRQEVPLVFPGNDRPGVMLAAGARRLLRRGVVPGRRAVVVTTGSDGHELATDLEAHGVEIEAIVDARPNDGAWSREPAADRARVLPGHGILRTIGRRVRGAVIAPLDESSTPSPSRAFRIDCDLVVLATGTIADAALLRQAGCLLDEESDGESRVRATAPHVHPAGSVRGIQSVEERTLDGERAGLVAALAVGRDQSALHAKQAVLEATLKGASVSRPAGSNGRLAPVLATGHRKAILCLCEDVTAADVAHAVAEGFDHVELLKRYLTISMGPCQGKMCSRAASEICATVVGETVTATGTTTARPPFQPVPLGVLAGRRLEPIQRTAMHARHEALGAEWMDAGMWRRPRAYGHPQEECRAVRERVGIIDVSTLGKLDVQGRDAGRLLERIYTHKFAHLAVGRVRYAVACDDSGIVLDDGTVCRRGPERFFVTTTTSGIGSMEAWVRWWAEGTGWQVQVTNITSSFAAVNLAGPRARDVLGKLTDLDISATALPYLTSVEGVVAGIPTLILRIGFVGELGYEMHFSADYGEAMWDALIQAGAEFDIRPFGIEAQRVLRLEKGHIIVSQDTDAVTTALEANLGWAVKCDKGDFVGKHALESTTQRRIRQRLVGFELAPGVAVPFEGDQVLDGNGRPVGRVSSVRMSPVLGRAIGLAMVPDDRTTVGSAVSIMSSGGVLRATIAALPFYDPDGARMRS